MYLNSVQIIGFIGKDPERRQARANNAAFTVLWVATRRSWKNADDEWASKQNGIAWLRGTPSASALRHRFARAITYCSKARSSAAPTTANTAKARSSQPSSIRSGRSALIRFASSIAWERSRN